MKRFILMFLLSLASISFSSPCRCSDPKLLLLNPIQYFHRLMDENGFRSSFCENLDECKTSVIYLRKSGEKWFQSGCCFNSGAIERFALWATKNSSLKEFEKQAKKILLKLIVVDKRLLMPSEFSDLWQKIEAQLKKGGVQEFVWHEIMLVQTEVDNFNFKFKVENYDFLSRPKI